MSHLNQIKIKLKPRVGPSGHAKSFIRKSNGSSPFEPDAVAGPGRGDEIGGEKIVFCVFQNGLALSVFSGLFVA